MLKGSIFSGRPYSSPPLSYATFIATHPTAATFYTRSVYVRQITLSYGCFKRVISRSPNKLYSLDVAQVICIFFLYFCRRRWRFRAETNGERPTRFSYRVVPTSVFTASWFILVQRLPSNETAHTRTKAVRNENTTLYTSAKCPPVRAYLTLFHELQLANNDVFVNVLKSF